MPIVTVVPTGADRPFGQNGEDGSMAKSGKSGERVEAATVRSGVWPVVWGCVLSCGFYAALPFLPVQREWAQRYFSAHWCEYVA